MFCVLMDEALSASSLPSGNHHAPTKQTDLEGIKAKENAELTFKPKLSKNSKRLAKSMGRNGSRPIHETLNDERRRYDANLHERVKAKHADEVQDCTFKPKIKKKKDGGAPHYVLTRKVFHGQGDEDAGVGVGADGASGGGSGSGAGVGVDTASISLSATSKTVDLDSHARMKQRRDRNMTSPGGVHVDSHHRWGESLRAGGSGMDFSSTMSSTMRGAGIGRGQEDDMIDQSELGSDSTAAERAGRREGTSAVVRLAEELINEGAN